MRTQRDSLDSKILRWSGAAMIAFLVGAIVAGAPGGSPAPASTVGRVELPCDGPGEPPTAATETITAPRT